MKLRNLLFAGLLIICSPIFLFAQDLQYLPVSTFIDIPDGIAANTVRAGVPFKINIYLSNDSMGALNQIIFPLLLKSPDSITEITYLPPDSGDIRLGSFALLNGFGDGGYWPVYNYVGGMSWDGILPDSMMHIGVSANSLWPPDSSFIRRYSMKLQIDQPGTICLEWFMYQTMLDPPPPPVKPFEPVCLRVVDTAVCGDASGNTIVNILDAVYLLSYIYRGGPPPVPLWTGDADNSGSLNIMDVSYLIRFLYKGGPAPVCTTVPSGDLINHGPCKSFMAAKIADTIASDQDCVQYEYDGSGSLLLKHINAGLNCCPIFAADVHISNNIITVVEKDSLDNGGCECLCLFDLDYVVHNIIPGIYTIRFIEPYKEPGDDPLEFTVDFRSNPSGQFCVSRCCYPWGQ